MNENKIWWQSSTALNSLPILEAYAKSLRLHAKRILTPEFEIEPKGVSRGTFDVHHPYFEHLNNSEIIEKLYNAHREGYAALAVGCFLDPGVREIRTVTDIPVLGMAETSMLMACMLGRRFSIVTYTSGLVDKKFPQLIRDYGLAERAAPFGCMNVSLEDLAKAFDNPKPIIDEFIRVSERLVPDGAEVILPGCGLLNMVLVKNGINTIKGGKIPVMDVVGVLLKQAEVMIGLRRISNLVVSRAGYYSKPEQVDAVRGIYGLK